MGRDALEPGQTVAVLVGLACLTVWLVVAGRLAWVGARTRLAPEIAMAAYFGLLALSFILGIPAALLREGGELAQAVRVSSASLFCFALAAFSLALGTWRTFRADAWWPGAVCGLLLVEMLAAWWMTISTGRFVSLATATPSNLWFALGRISIYAWAFGDAFGAYRRLRKRVSLGLADPLVAHRILLWGVAALGMGLSAAVITIRSQVFGLGEQTELTAGAFLGLSFSLGGTLSIWLAFFPPGFYRRRIVGAASGESS